MRKHVQKPSTTGEGLPTVVGAGLGLAAAGVWYCTNKLLTKYVVPKIEGNSNDDLGTRYLNKIEAIYDETVGRFSREFKTSISLEYEEKCILNPLQYKGDSATLEALKSYQDLMSGKIIDTTLTHIPSENINGSFNPDYLRYLNVQKNIGITHPWVTEELNRVNDLNQMVQLLSKAKNELAKRGVPNKYLDDVVTLERCSLFGVEDWDQLVEAIKIFDVENFKPEAIKIYMGCFIHCYNLGELATLDALLTYGNNIPVFINIVDSIQKGFTADNVKSCITNVIELDYSWEKSFQCVLEGSRTNAEANTLRMSYQKKVME
jgi:hypothetical protein